MKCDLFLSTQFFVKCTIVITRENIRIGVLGIDRLFRTGRMCKSEWRSIGMMSLKEGKLTLIFDKNKR
jgi:hypothetical protein